MVKVSRSAQSLLDYVGWKGQLPIQRSLFDQLAIDQAGLIIPVDFNDLKGETSASLKVDFDADQPGFLIQVNPQELLVRQRFAWAYGLGACVLGQVGPRSHSNSMTKVEFHREDWQSIDAIDFAMELLMPKHLALEAINHSTSVSEMAGWFKVSPTTYRLRLKQLGIL